RQRARLQERVRQVERVQRTQRLQRQQRAGQPPRARRTATDDRALLGGITLSAGQRERLETVRERYRSRTVELRRSLADSRLRADSARRAATLQQSRAVRDQVSSLRQQQLSELREILTPEQQKTF